MAHSFAARFLCEGGCGDFDFGIEAAIGQWDRFLPAKLLLSDAAYKEASHIDQWHLYQLGRGKLTVSQRQTLLPRLVPSSDQLASWDFQKLQARLIRVREANLPGEAKGALAAAWLKSRDANSLSDPRQLGFLNMALNCGGVRATQFTVFLGGIC